MQLPDGTVLMHADAPYDPVKAHQYYLLRRKLHPRDAAKIDKLSSARSGVHTFTVKTHDGKTVKLTAAQLTEQRVYANARVAHIKAKLTSLKAELHKRMAEAKRREANAKKPPTAAEKSKAARDAKQYRQKHQQQLATKAKQASTNKPAAPGKKTETVASLKEEITKTRDSLKAAVAKQRELATAKENG